MSGKYQAYPEYKDSGVEWLGKLPTNWGGVRLKYLAPIVTEKATDRRNPLGLENIESWTGKLQVTDSEFQGDGTRFIAGDLLFGKLRPYLAKVLLAQSEGEAVGDFHVLRPLHNDSRYLQYQMLTREFISIVDGSTYGAKMPRASWEFMGNLTCSRPSLIEQRTIAAFLDHETARIDRLIEKQQRLIELLKEKRQAVISHAVTKGLDPHMPMKDSGIEWLGQVPEHWKVSRIKNYAKIESGHTPDKKKAEYWTDCDIPWVSLNDSKTLKVVDYIDDTAYKVNELGIANSSARLLPAQAVVFTRDASIGLSAITTRPMAVSQHLIAWLCKSQKLLPEYLLLVFYGMEKEFERYTFGATIKTIGMDDVRSLSASFPPLAEQRAIVHWAFQKIKQLQQGVSKAEEAVGLLQERRTALISAAVTGKIDVRNWQPNTSTQSGEPDLPMAAEQAGRYHV
ncbi:type I restriction enzyme S subunit [Marinobacterium sp. MBR-111]|uniref:restriction endonuclease subunit S n=1 Tax=Marinobacterium sp. MBR-111 TaxID=3156463 RepID=UPI003398E3DC